MSLWQIGEDSRNLRATNAALRRLDGEDGLKVKVVGEDEDVGQDVLAVLGGGFLFTLDYLNRDGRGFLLYVHPDGPGPGEEYYLGSKYYKNTPHLHNAIRKVARMSADEAREYLKNKP